MAILEYMTLSLSGWIETQSNDQLVQVESFCYRPRRCHASLSATIAEACRNIPKFSRQLILPCNNMLISLQQGLRLPNGKMNATDGASDKRKAPLGVWRF
jgi:hypothetical protein